MPGTAGADFIKSLEGVFEEFEAKGFNDRNEIQGVASQIIELILACGRMTCAKARASCPVLLPDGSVPASVILFPPSKFNLEEQEQKRLRQVSSGSEFIMILKETFQREYAPYKERIRRKRDRRAAAKRAKRDSRRKAAALAMKTAATVPPVTPPRPTTPVKAEDDTEQHPIPTPSGAQDLAIDGNPGTMDVPIKAEPGVRHGVDQSVAVMNVDSDDETENFSLDMERESLRTAVLERIRLAVSAARYPESAGFENQKAELTVALDRLNVLFARFGPLFTREPYKSLDVNLERLFLERIDGIPEADWEDFKTSLLDALATLKTNMKIPRPADFNGDPFHPRKRFLEMTPNILESLLQSSVENAIVILRTIDRMCGWRKIRKLDFEMRFMLFTDMAYSYELNVAALNGRWEGIEYLTELCAQIAREVGPEGEIVPEMQMRRVSRARLRQVKRIMSVYEDMHEVDATFRRRYEERIG